MVSSILRNKDNLPSKNSSSAGNQQERLAKSWWIVGFTDGEGCFSVSIFKNKTSKYGWQVMPEFVLTQGASSLESLQMVQHFFSVGHIFINRRYDNHHEPLYRYCVRNRNHLTEVIIPFFQKHPLKTNKHRDFALFSRVVREMNHGRHRTEQGLQAIATLVGKTIL